MTTPVAETSEAGKQIFECEICYEEYEVTCDHEIDKISIDPCRHCGGINVWGLPKESDQR